MSRRKIRGIYVFGILFVIVFAAFFFKDSGKVRTPSGYSYYYLDDKFRLVNKEGFENAYEYDSEEYALAASFEDHNFHFIDSKGKYVEDIPEIETSGQWTRRLRVDHLGMYTYVSTMDRLYIFRDYKLVGYLNSLYVYDTSEDLITICNFENLQTFTSELFQGYYGCIDRDGNTVIDVKYKYLGAFSPNGLAPAMFDDGSFGYINKDEEIIINLDSNVTLADSFDDNGRYAIVEVTSGNEKKYGVIDSVGSYVLDPVYSYVRAFTEGQYIVSEDGEKYGVINLAGDYVIEPVYKEISPLRCGLAAAENEDGLWGYIDATGKKVIDFQFNYARNFTEEGYATVFDGDNYGFIDRQGKWKLKPQFMHAGDFENGRVIIALYDNQKIKRR